MVQEDVTVDDEVEKLFTNEARLLKSKFRLELHIFVNEFLSICNHVSGSRPISDKLSEDAKFISGLATKLLLLLTEHVKKLAEAFFAGMIIFPGSVFCSYMICWKCVSSDVSFNSK